MPTAIHIEDHAVDRYVERVRDCSFHEARQYLKTHAAQGALLRERTQALIAVVTVLGPDETGAAGGDEMADLNRLADASRHAPSPRIPYLLREEIPPEREPRNLGECLVLQQELRTTARRLQAHLSQRPKPVDHISAKEDYTHITRRLSRLKSWALSEMMRIEREPKAPKAPNPPPPPTPPALPPMTKSPNANPVVQSLLDKISREHAKHMAHAEHMEADRRVLREALRAAVRVLVKNGLQNQLRETDGVDPAFLKPEFYDLRKKPN